VNNVNNFIGSIIIIFLSIDEADIALKKIPYQLPYDANIDFVASLVLYRIPTIRVNEK